VRPYDCVVRTPRALLFDLDGTLLAGSGDPEAIRRTCVVLAEAQPALDANALVRINAEVWARYWPTVEQAWTLGRLASDALGMEVWRRTLRANGLDDETLVRLARSTHRKFQAAALHFYDDARALLDALPKAMRIGIVSNGASDTKRLELQALGMERRVSAVVISGEVGAAKPDPAVFRVALDQLGLAPEDVWHIGDSVTTDVLGALRAGVTAIWLNREGASSERRGIVPDLEIHALTELVPMLTHGFAK